MNSQKKPLVTVGLPVYNGENGILSSIESIISQDYENFELIILDNASVDSTPEIIKEYQLKDQRIKYFRNEENIGAINNFQKVSEMCSGKYFSWLAHDDYREPSFLSKCVEKLEANPSAGLCSADVTVIDYQGNVLNAYEGHLAFMGMETLGMNVVNKVSDFFIRACCCCIYGVIRNDVLKTIGNINNVFGFDYIFLVEMLLKTDFVRVPEKLIYYRISQKSIPQYLDLLFSDKTKPKKAFTDKAKKLINVILESSITNQDKSEILERFFSLIPNNHLWAVSLSQENQKELEFEMGKYFFRGILTDFNELILNRNISI